MQVQITIPIKEVNGNETDIGEPLLTVKNHWNRSGGTYPLVVLELEGLEPLSVPAYELIQAVKKSIDL